jgi:hypothetical protein
MRRGGGRCGARSRPDSLDDRTGRSSTSATRARFDHAPPRVRPRVGAVWEK